MIDKRTENSLVIEWSIGKRGLGVNLGTRPTYRMSFQPVRGYVYVHKLSMAHPPKIFNTAKCSHLFVDLLKFQEHIGII